MVWRLGARVHAFMHGLFKPSEAELVREQWNEVAGLFRALGIAEPGEQEHLIAALAENVQARLDIPAEHEQAALVHAFIAEVFGYEGLFQLPVIDWSESRTIAELWDIREEITRNAGSRRISKRTANSSKRHLSPSWSRSIQPVRPCSIMWMRSTASPCPPICCKALAISAQ